MKNAFKIRPLLPLLLILLLMIIVYAIAHFYPVTWDSLQAAQVELARFHQLHPLWTPILFIVVYILSAVISFPAIFLLSLLAGFLFEQPFGTLYVLFATTAGASLLYLIARTAFGATLYCKADPRLQSLKNGFLENAASYLLFLRLLPLFPYWVVNIAGAFFEVPFKTFVWTTILGMLPSVFIYVQAGQGFAVMFNNPAPLSPTLFLNAHLVSALIGLSLLSLAPILYKRLSRSGPFEDH